ncbi:MAG: methyltransferase domain-containing protein [Myxococcota bacterium]|nr:methyltransferase domain-containing protein [Myxococcota bacterium]
MTDTASIQKSYDQLPYDTCAYARTHPNRIGSLAHMMGLKAPSLRGARILEIGCADGGNLLPMAYGLPEAECWGFDLSPAQIERGQADLDAIGLANVRLDVARVEDAPYPGQKFDYILAHGIYSWVPVHVRAQILAYIADRLTPNGLAFVSLNVYPGWRGRERVRDFIYHMCGREPHPTIEHGEQVMGFLKHLTTAHEAFPYGPMGPVCDMAQTWSRMTPGLLAHGPLAQINDPCYFDEFAVEFRKHGLDYVADAEDGWVTAHHPLFANFGLSGFLEAHPERIEQAIDFIRNQAFRRTILTRQTNGVQRPLNIDANRLQTLHLVGRTTADLAAHAMNSTDPLVFRQLDNDALSATVNEPMTKYALAALVEHPWRPIAFHALVAHVEQRMERPLSQADQGVLCRDLTELFSHGLVELHLEQPKHLTGERPKLPEAHPVARHFASRQGHVPSYRHGTVEINDFQRVLLSHMDGTQSVDDLVSVLQPRVPSHSAAELRAAIEADVDRLDDACLLARHPSISD